MKAVTIETMLYETFLVPDDAPEEISELLQYMDAQGGFKVEHSWTTMRKITDIVTRDVRIEP